MCVCVCQRKNYRLLGEFAKLRKATISFVISVSPSICVCPSEQNSAPTIRISMKFYTCIFSENPSIKFKFHSNLTRITGTLHKNLCTLTIVPRWILLRMRYTSISDKLCRKTKIHILPSVIFFPRKSGCLRDNVEKDGTATQAKDDNIIKRMRN